MNKIYSIVAGLLLTVCVFAQAPQKMSYQAVIRDNSSALITSTTVGMQISILQGSSTGTAVYVETQTPSTNANGLVSLEIGTGTVITGTFATINWATGPYFIKTETDPTGGTAYTIFGTNELMSVPYALFSANGATGATGATGAAGTNGTNGLDGATGATGAAGTNGTNGLDGATGATGAAGTNGTNGLDGATGATGVAGATGSAGSAGSTGATGATGLTGATGAVGATGAAGTNGTNGLDGATGATGANGSNGATGATGAVGATGVAGATGSAGSNGATGAVGATGVAGATGANGSNGATGAVGATGVAGATGANGSNGATGATGLTGATGPTGAAGQGGVTIAGTGINVTGAGTIASPYVVSTTSPCGLAIGQTYQGGIIFYLDASGCHGLISAPTDQSIGITWYSGSYLDTYASGSGLFDGDGNCYRIRRSQGDCASCNAAEICLDLTIGVYSDWYLPSKYELNLMYRNIGQGNALGLGNVGGFAFNYYWSSTENDNYDASSQYFSNGNQVKFTKNVTFYVRAVRAF